MTPSCLAMKSDDRERGDAPRLGHAYEAVPGIARLVEDDRQLSGLARTGRALHDDDLVVLESL